MEVNIRIKVRVSDEHREEIVSALTVGGFEVCEEADFLLSEINNQMNHVSVRSSEGKKIYIPYEQIVYIESFGHDVIIHTTENTEYVTASRLYQLAEALDKSRFLRVSNSVIISKEHVKKIKPALSMKFVLTMSDQTLVDVTRTYYNSFKEFFRI